MNIRKTGFIALCLTLLSTATFALMSPTVTQNGYWNSLSSFLVVDAKIGDKSERVCLPKLEFTEEVDKDLLDQQMREGLKPQDAVFHLYHDGLGKPKKQGGMFYASDVFLKDLNMTYTGYLRKLGYKFKVSSTPSYEDSEFLRDVVTSESSSASIKKRKKAEEEVKKEEAKKEKPGSKSNLRVATVYDVLPKGVIPPSIRSQQLRIAKIVNNLKNRPYETEIIQMDPLRWASGYMGMLNEKGEIIAARCEGQIIDFGIRVPEKAGWLTPEMLKEIQNTPCEYVLSRYKNGLEVFENGKYLLHDIYFGKLKLTWEEWLEKHNLKCPEFIEKPEYATGVIPIEIHKIDGILKSLDALSLIQVNFTQKSKLVFPQELMRIFPPKPKPTKKQVLPFIKAFNKKFQGKPLDVHLMVCPDGKSYNELGQKRAKRIFFNDTLALFTEAQQEILKEISKEE